MQKKKTNRLSQRLNQAVKNVSVDVFGYTEIVEDNMRYFLKHIALKSHSTIQELNAEIKTSSLKPFLVMTRNESLLGTYNLEQMVQFFMGQNEITHKTLDKIQNEINSFFNELSLKHNIQFEAISLKISMLYNKSKVWVCVDGKYLEEIKLNKLVKRFA